MYVFFVTLKYKIDFDIQEFDLRFYFKGNLGNILQEVFSLICLVISAT